jgi:amino acid transporter
LLRSILPNDVLPNFMFSKFNDFLKTPANSLILLSFFILLLLILIFYFIISAIRK